MSSKTLKKNVMSALLGALAFVVMLLVPLPILPSAPFLKYEPSGMVILLAVVMLGPFHGMMACLVKDGLFLLVGAGNIFGVTSDFIATAAFAITAGVLVRQAKSVRMKLLGYVAGTIAGTLIMIPVNLVILKLEFGMSPETVMGMMLPAILPFNILKGGLNAAVYQLLGQPVTRAASKHLL